MRIKFIRNYYVINLLNIFQSGGKLPSSELIFRHLIVCKIGRLPVNPRGRPSSSSPTWRKQRLIASKLRLFKVFAQFVYKESCSSGH